jgi:hypothetical protein
MMCRGAVEAMTDADEGKLSGWRKVSYRVHLAICPFCRGHRAQVDKTVAALASLPKEPPSPDALSRAAEAFKNRKRDV